MRIGSTFLLLVATAAAGCSSLQADSGAAAEIAQQFHAALQAGKGAEMCSVVAASTAEHMEMVTGTTCEDGIVEAGVPAAEGVTAVDVYGRAAQVRMHGDTVFLTKTSQGWKVIAAGCRARGDEPYECRVEGK
ncbi:MULTISPECIES: hypothetical protein [Rhodococcus erythropolis group]|uniref:hypothetical protein n=1 Tax=Rhodococcus erythropolis group TaxID=2840174 RepID=UPI001BE76B7C|nr:MULTISPECIES: hypothetical protein [Rhodococcus erythropolis group]MBT2269677.1 hypothetical protein [Rhodococcus erythropolis]MBT2274194.1 hypothetical protein [Rhodococcus qingshengii]